MKKTGHSGHSAHRATALDPGATWAADAYLSFSGPRLRPAVELLARIPGSPRHIVDLGCGAGGPTRVLARRWQGARIVAIDRSESMLLQARAGLPDDGSDDGSEESGADIEWRQIEWRQGDVASWRPDGNEAPDLIFSNACLHWIGSHDELFPRLVSYLPPGGVLAVQMPLSWPQPSHRLMRDVLAELGLDHRVPSIQRRPVDEPDVYVRRLRRCAERVDVWTTTYQQILDGEEPVFRFVESTGLRPVRDALDGDDWQRFEAAYRRRLVEAYPRDSDGTTIFPFRRLFLVAVVSA